MRTWERGSGITLACGTGACAVCVAGVLTGRTDRTSLAHLPGGDLELTGPTTRSVFMTGPGHRSLLRRMARLIKAAQGDASREDFASRPCHARRSAGGAAPGT